MVHGQNGHLGQAVVKHVGEEPKSEQERVPIHSHPMEDRAVANQAQTDRTATCVLAYQVANRLN
jgi:hypothetical protein